MEGEGFADFLRRRWIAVTLAPIATALGLVVGSTIDRAVGLAMAAAVLFCLALFVGYRESQHLEAERHRAVIDEIHSAEHRRATSERLASWVPRLLRADEDDAEADEPLVDRAV